MTGTVLLLAGPAGAGKTSLGAAWCATRAEAAQVQLDVVRDLIRHGLADPRDLADPRQPRQWLVAVQAACALVRAFAEGGVDVVVDDVLLPADAERVWRLLLAGLPARLVVLLPTLATCRDRGGRRGKDVPEQLVRDQYAGSLGWPETRRLDTTGQSVSDSLAALLVLLRRPAVSWG